MERYIEILVEERTQENKKQTVESVLKRQAGFTKRQISQAKFRAGGIRKNGKQCRVTEMVCAGDSLMVCLEEAQMGSEKREWEEDFSQPDILYEDPDLLAVNKPAGMVTHPAGIHYKDTLSNQIAGYYRRKGKHLCVRSIGRLDRETSGIVVFAKNRTAAARMQMQKENGVFQKTYLAVAKGRMQEDRQETWHTIETFVGPDPADARKMRVFREGIFQSEFLWKKAVTHYQVLKSTEDKSLVQLKLETGRMHQIRIHMADMGHPLMGDTLYGEEGDVSRAALHAWKTECCQPFTGEKIKITAPFPTDFKKLISVFGSNTCEKNQKTIK